MDDAERFKECIFHLIKWLGGTDSMNHLQPLAGNNTHRMAVIAYKVAVEGKTTQQAVEETNG